MTQTETPTVFMVSVLTPYLTEQLTPEFGFERAMRQVSEYGFNPNNLSETDGLITPNRNVVVLNKPGFEGFNRPRFDESRLREELQGSDLVIVGSATASERRVFDLMNSGHVFGRYSIFYGGPSDYSGRTPEEGGYSLDIPKNIESVRALLTSDETLEALRSRDPQRVRQALTSLPDRNGAPILATTFLEEALRR